MPDRVKEAVFAILGNYYDRPGALPALRVADVFSGGGSIGLEALSRGAASCRFFERDGAALEALRENIRALGANGAVTIETGDAWGGAVLDADGEPFDLVLLDPPYSESADTSAAGRIRRYLGRLAERDDNRPLVVLHHQATVGFDLGQERVWRVVDQRRFGGNRVTYFSR